MTITDAGDRGIHIADTSVTVSGTTVTGSVRANFAFLSGTFPDPWHVSISDSHFDESESSYGIDIFTIEGSIELSGVTTEANARSGVFVQTSGDTQTTLTNVSATRNANWGLELLASATAHFELIDSDGDENALGGGTISTRIDATAHSVGSDPTGNGGPGWEVDAWSPGSVTFERATAAQNPVGFQLSLWAGPTVSIVDSAITGGSVGVGVDAQSSALSGGTVRIERTHVAGVGDNGLYVVDSPDVDIDVIDTEIEFESTSSPGAALHAELLASTLTLDRTTITENPSASAVNVAASVIGDDDSSFRMISSKFEGNPGSPGLALDVAVPEVTIAHSTLRGGDTGAFLARLDGRTSATVTHSIFEGGAFSLWTQRPTLTVDHSLVLTPAPNAEAAVAAGTGNLTGVSAALGPLADNGGFVRTLLPEPGSPVIDAGSATFAAPPDLDQRGLARVAGARIDIGAVEVVPALAATGRDAGATWAVGLGLLGLGAAVGMARLLHRSRRRQLS